MLIETVRLMDFRVGDRSTLSPCNILPSATSLGKLSTTPTWKNEARTPNVDWEMKTDGEREGDEDEGNPGGLSLDRGDKDPQKLSKCTCDQRC